MKIDFPIVPIQLTLGREHQPKMLAKPLANAPGPARADAKETAIACLSAALLFASLAVLALTTER